MSLNDRLSSKESSDMTTEAGTKHVFATCLPRVFQLFATCTCVRHVYMRSTRVHAFATCLSCVCTCARVCHLFPMCLPRAHVFATCLPRAHVFATCLPRVCHVFATCFHVFATCLPRVHVFATCFQRVCHV